MSSKPITPFQLFKVLVSILIYITASAAWLLFGIRLLISSTSDVGVIAGLLGTAVWLIASACLYLLIITPKPGRSAKTKEKNQ